MRITSDVLDVSKYLEENFEPATLIGRVGKKWLIRDLPFDFFAPEGVKVRRDAWATCSEGDFVRIPIFPYCARCDDPVVAVGYAFELGLKALKYAQEFRFDVNISQIHIALGHPVEEQIVQGRPVLRFWLGCGFVIEG